MTAPHQKRGTCTVRNIATRIPAMSAMCSPEIAKMCIVPDCMKGAVTSPVSAVFQPSVIAQSNFKGSSTSGKPRASVCCDHVRKRSLKDGVELVESNFQSSAEAVLSWK